MDSFSVFFRYLTQQLACPSLIQRPHVLGTAGLSRAVCFTCNAIVVSCSATSPSSSHVSRSFSIHWLIEVGLLHVQWSRFPFLDTSPSSSHVHHSFSSLLSWVQLDYHGQFALRAMQLLSPTYLPLPAARMSAAHFASTGLSRAVCFTCKEFVFCFLAISPSSSHVSSSFSIHVY